jgi:hypothetical protein
MGKGRKLENLNDFKRALKGKYGVGVGVNYTPWLRIQDVHSHGTRSQIQGIKSNRIHHTLSSIESEFFYLAEFSDTIIDIREQFPLFPLNLSIKMAETFGVKHPAHPITKQPIIMTTDFLLTQKIDEIISYHAISVKHENAANKQRVLEKIDIERNWWESLGIPFHYFTGNELTRCQSRNISWATSAIRSRTVLFSQSEIEIAVSLLHLGRYFKKDICNMFVKSIGVEHDNALNLLLTLIAEKHIEVDLSVLIEESDFIEIISLTQQIKGVENGGFN